MSREILRGISTLLTGLTVLLCAPGSAFSGEQSLFEELSVPLVALAPKPYEFQPFPDPQPDCVQPRGAVPRCRQRNRALLEYGLPRIASDFRHFYSRDSLLNFGLALGGTAILANTSMDENFLNWYHREIGHSLDQEGNVFRSFAKGFGEGDIMIPLILTAAIGYRYFQDVDLSGRRQSSFLGEVCARTSRSYLVGGTFLFAGQYAVGASRPSHPAGSKWRPFCGRPNGISGHAFIGAVPFLTAAQMTDHFWLKGCFFVGSFFTAWSRIQDDAHYLSQVLLGWYIAYLSVRAVSKTEGETPPKGLTFFPVCDGDGVGLGFSFRR